MEWWGFLFLAQTSCRNFTFICWNLCRASGRDLTMKLSLQCRAYTCGLHTGLSKSQLLPGPKVAVVINDWCIRKWVVESHGETRRNNEDYKQFFIWVLRPVKFISLIFSWVKHRVGQKLSVYTVCHSVCIFWMHYSIWGIHIVQILGWLQQCFGCLNLFLFFFIFTLLVWITEPHTWSQSILGWISICLKTSSQNWNGDTSNTLSISLNDI